MAIGIPENGEQVEDRIRADVQREAPDSNPYLRVSFLGSLIGGISRRMYDFYGDLNRTQTILFPHSADEETVPRFANIYLGSVSPASFASGRAVATGAAGSVIPADTVLSQGINYKTTTAATISDQAVNIISITRTGNTAQVTTAGDHLLALNVPVTISGSDQSQYNIADVKIVITGQDSFTYQVTGSPVTPATGTMLANHTSASVPIIASTAGAIGNLGQGSPLTMQSATTGVDSSLSVDFGTVGGGTEAETIEQQKERYLDKIRNPVAHFNPNAIKAKAKEVPGVTRVFVDEAGDTIGTLAVSSITRSGNVATANIPSHGFDDGATVTITGAGQPDYNVTEARIIVENSDTIHYVVIGDPASPAIGTITASAKLPLGMSRAFFMRDNDENPIPSVSEVETVKERVDSIKPANTSTHDVIISAPTPNVTNYVFSELEPNTRTMREAVTANIAQFHEEETTVGVNDDAKAYEAAIKNTVDPVTGDKVISFTLSSPTGDLVNGSGEIATLGTVTYP